MMKQTDVKFLKEMYLDSMFESEQLANHYPLQYDHFRGKMYAFKTALYMFYVVEVDKSDRETMKFEKWLEDISATHRKKMSVAK